MGSEIINSKPDFPKPFSRKTLLRVHEGDNVLVALKEIPPGASITVQDEVIDIQNQINPGHKVAAGDIDKGDPVIKYGAEIGIASREIKKGEHVHSHNLASSLEKNFDRFLDEISETDFCSKKEGDKRDEVNTGKGQTSSTIHSTHSAQKKTLTLPDLFAYIRDNGEVAIRNELWILPTVACVNSVTQNLSETLKALPAIRDKFENIQAFPHPYGCSQLGEDADNTSRIIENLALHPHSGLSILVGLGCENNRIANLRESLSAREKNANQKGEKDILYFNIQELQKQDADKRSSFFDEKEESESFLDKITSEISAYVAAMKKVHRKKISWKELKFGLKCGGSDPFSGLTANPLLGLFTDLIIAEGSSALFTEIPESFGAERELLERCADRESCEKLIFLYRKHRAEYARENQMMDKNPSPGNIESGITTLAEKSLSAVQKSGRGPIRRVLDYGETFREQGLALVNGPGNDPVSVTALSASGAHLVLFTTGLGTPLGGPVPTVKISSRKNIYTGFPSWIDFSAHELLEEHGDSIQVLQNLLDLLADIINGKKQSKNEINGDRQIAIWKSGITL